MRRVEVGDAVGLPLGHDITEIISERKIKHVAFRRGHVITTEDIPRLLDLGKSAIYVFIYSNFIRSWWYFRSTTC